MYVMGGVDGKGERAPATPLVSECFPFDQKAGFDFVGNKEQNVVVKPAKSICELKNVFTVEAVCFMRNMAGYAPIFTRCDPAFKTGFGLVGLEHPAFKGDAEEGAWVHFFVGNWGVSGGGQEIKVKMEADKWTHIAGVYDGKQMRIYLDGTFKDTFDYETTEEDEIHAKGDVHIGGLPGKYAWDGLVDEVRLWDVALSEEEIRANMNKTYVGDAKTGATEHLLGQWTFNEGAGELVIDSSGNKNHGSFERYAGGVELRRVQSRRGRIEPMKTEREKHIDACFLKLQKWKREYEMKNGREPTKADIVLAEPEISTIAKRLGEL